jgi:hypothetical protein
MNPDQAKQDKTKSIIDMAFGFSAMTRVFEKGSDRKIIGELDCSLPKIASSKYEQDFQKQHDCFCRWFKDEIKTAERKSKNDERVIKPSGPASYGQGAKVLDVALKVFVYYCHLPDLETADRTMKWLYAAIDTKMMKHLKNMKDPEASIITATSIEDVDDEMIYTALQSLVRKDIENRDKSPNKIYPVQWDDIMWRELNRP